MVSTGTPRFEDNASSDASFAEPSTASEASAKIIRVLIKVYADKLLVRIDPPPGDTTITMSTALVKIRRKLVRNEVTLKFDTSSATRKVAFKIVLYEDPGSPGGKVDDVSKGGADGR